MKTAIHMIVLSLVLMAAQATFTGATAKADDYWDGYWSWYDGTYRPYYSRHYSYRPYYGRYYDGDYDYGYSPGYYGRYYGTPGVGYWDAPGGGGQVRVGPLRFGWR